MLLVLFGLVACDGPLTTLYTFAPLPGTPRGIVLADDGNLLVTHEDGGACCRATAFVPSASTQVRELGAGPGRPMLSDGRTYVPMPDGVLAMQGDDAIWEVVEDRPRVEHGHSAVLPDGTVVFATFDGLDGALHAYTRLGEPAWTTLLGAEVDAGMRAGSDGMLYFHGTDLESRLYAVDGEDGGILWSEIGTDLPLAVLDEGLLVSRGQRLTLLDHEGQLLWSSAAEVGEAGVTLTHDGHAWAVGPTLVSKVGLDDGFVHQAIQVTCGPLAYGVDNKMWGVCEAGREGQVALTTIDAVALEVSTPFAGVPVGAPVLDAGSAYVVIGGDSPRLLGFAGATLPSTTSPWSTAFGLGNTGRPDQ